ncbi:MAG TPA: hypothetical protein PLD47_17770 [Aggregatilineales bacterium]|nr:hypothetical protein [Anaerolineales bacterium]HRE49578.1 hypothetical protein [Aggregatilineales bacterium]
MSSTYPPEAVSAWKSARWKAFWSRFFTLGRTHPLLNFQEVVDRLHLRNSVYRGVQIIPLNKIVGSFGRYHDFNRAFLPMRDFNRDRWIQVAALNLAFTRGGAPPVELYKVGEWYFVKDGNHRISVAHHFKAETIEAYVWEYIDTLPVSSDELQEMSDIDALLVAGERRDFLETTHLDRLRPDAQVELTRAGGYLEILCQIAAYQEALECIDEVEIPYQDAVAAWYDMQYEPILQLMGETDISTLFPSYTPTDFYVWLMRQEEALKKRYGGRASLFELLKRVRRRRQRQRLLSWLVTRSRKA